MKGTAAHFVMFTDERLSVMGGQREQISRARGRLS
jgi:hypothetical protein